MNHRANFFSIVSICILWLAHFQSAAQELKQRIDIHFTNTPLGEVLNSLSKTSHYQFFFSGENVDKQRKITLSSEGASLETFLNELLASQDLRYSIVGNTIIITKRPLRRPDAVISGTVVESRSHEPLVGVTVRVKGSNIVVSTDGNGKFNIKTSQENAVLQISYIGYATKEIRVAGRATIIVQLDVSSKALTEVLVQARRRVDNEVTVLKERQNASVVSDGISAKQIEKTASITTTQALQRVTGVTITDDKYVAIRGLGDRSVIAELNGARLSSANPERSSVPLDLVPAALLDNVTVYKTLTPDRPADAAAGIIELKTKSIPDSLTVSFTAQTGFNNTIGIDGKFNGFRNSDLGYFGQRVSDYNLSPQFKALQAQYPGGIADIQKMFIESRYSQAGTAEAFRVNKIMQSFDPVLTTSYQQAVPNQIYTASFGDVYKIFHGHDLGVILTGNYYERTEDRYHGELNQYSIYQGLVTGSLNPVLFNAPIIPRTSTPDHLILGKNLAYEENTGIQTLNYGVLAGLSYRFSKGNEMSFQYLGSRGADAEGTYLLGSYQNSGKDFPVYSTVNGLRRSYRTFNTLNLQGEHHVFSKSWVPFISYNLSSSTSSQNDPDYRFTDLADARQTTAHNPGGSSITADTYQLIEGTVNGYGPLGVIQVEPNGRFYRKLTENNYNGKIDLSEHFNLFGFKQEFKTGFNYLKRFRRYTENVLGIPGTAYGGDLPLLQKVLNSPNGSLDELVSTNNIALGNSPGTNLGAPRVGGFLYQILKTPNNYFGIYQTRAAYAMADLHLLENLRLVGGVRFESTDIKATVDTTHVFNPASIEVSSFGNIIHSINATDPNTGYHTKLTPYYSVNLIYVLEKRMNFRVSYNTALARPELREITNVYQFDPFQFAVVGGNRNLTNQLNRNVDFRWEWFPSSGEVFSASAFGKKIYHQLSRYFIYTSQGTTATTQQFPVIIYENEPEVGTVYGLEFEAKKNLGKLFGSLRNFYVGSNLLLAASDVKKNPQRLEASRTIDRFAPSTSPIFEQAPYSINAYIDYDNQKTGTNVSVNFNEVGERLVQVQLDGTPDLFNRPVPILDFVFGQRITKRFQIKGFAKNLLNPAYETVYAVAGNRGKYYGNTFINHRYFRGSEFLLGLTYNLF